MSVHYCCTVSQHRVHSGHGSHQTRSSHGSHCYCNAGRPVTHHRVLGETSMSHWTNEPAQHHLLSPQPHLFQRSQRYSVCTDISRLYVRMVYDACSGWTTIVIPALQGTIPVIAARILPKTGHSWSSLSSCYISRVTLRLSTLRDSQQNTDPQSAILDFEKETVAIDSAIKGKVEGTCVCACTCNCQLSNHYLFTTGNKWRNIELMGIPTWGASPLLVHEHGYCAWTPSCHRYYTNLSSLKLTSHIVPL